MKNYYDLYIILNSNIDNKDFLTYKNMCSERLNENDIELSNLVCTTFINDIAEFDKEKELIFDNTQDELYFYFDFNLYDIDITNNEIESFFNNNKNCEINWIINSEKNYSFLKITSLED
ncbi:MAG: hypothetical protein M0R46_10100 [Candidatus Muirbacterium halophilum]|nr:hypothetical protein [Candidatus Muirbacterium halophilum]